MCKLDELRAKRKEIYEIARKHKAEKIYIFGSCARKEETPESDIDFLVKFSSRASLFDLMNLEDDLKIFSGRDVDVVSRNGIHPFLKDNILREAVEL